MNIFASSGNTFDEICFFYFVTLSSVLAIDRASDIYGLVIGTFWIHAHA